LSGYLIFREICDIILKVDAMDLEKGMHFHPGLKAWHLASGGFGQQLCTVALKRKCLKDDPRRVLDLGMTCCANSFGILQGNLHRG
jgi:hypothetical protein